MNNSEIAKILKSEKKSKSPIRYGIAVSVADKYVTVIPDGSDSMVICLRCCLCAVGDRVVIIINGTQWLCVGTVGVNKIRLSPAPDISPTSDPNNAALAIGEDGGYLMVDGNQIQAAKLDGTRQESWLGINNEGGNVGIGNADSEVTIGGRYPPRMSRALISGSPSPAVRSCPLFLELFQHV